ncbi:MAG: NnrU family protein [Pseudomonadota bacterium]
MTLLILGLVLWIAGHLFKRALPSVRQGMGDAGKGVAALVIVASVIAMIIGYRQADYIPVYDPPLWTRHINNLLMIVAVILFGLGSSKSPWRAKLRHPMLLGMATWAVAHLLVNGDVASVLLFGVLGLWALGTIALINAKDHDYVPFSGGSTAGTVRLMGISTVLFAVMAAVHTWLGYWPFPA